MPDFVNTGGPVDVYAKAGSAESLHVDTGQTMTVPGEITNDAGDAYIVGEGDSASAWPKSRWQIKTSKKQSGSQPASAAAAAEGTN